MAPEQWLNDHQGCWFAWPRSHKGLPAVRPHDDVAMHDLVHAFNLKAHHGMANFGNATVQLLPNWLTHGIINGLQKLSSLSAILFSAWSCEVVLHCWSNHVSQMPAMHSPSPKHMRSGMVYVSSEQNMRLAFPGFLMYGALLSIPFSTQSSY